MEGLSDEAIQTRLEATTKAKFKEFIVDVKRINPKLRCTPVSSLFDFTLPSIPWLSNTYFSLDDLRYGDTYTDLIVLTTHLVRDHLTETAWYASAIAQRVDADSKLEASVEWVPHTLLVVLCIILIIA